MNDFERQTGSAVLGISLAFHLRSGSEHVQMIGYFVRSTAKWFVGYVDT